MTRMEDLQRYQALAFEYWAGELSPVEKREIEDALVAHPALAAYFARIKHLLDDVDEDVAAQWTPQRADAVWQRIDAALDRTTALEPSTEPSTKPSTESSTEPSTKPSTEPKDALETVPSSGDAPAPSVDPLSLGVHLTPEVQEDAPQRSNAWTIGGLSLAALALALLGSLLVFGGDDPASQAARSGASADGVAHAPARVAPENEGAAAPAASDAPAPARALVDRVAALAAQPAPFGGALYASDDAIWSGTADDEAHTLRLEHGTLLVEFLPNDARGLRVQTPDLRARVVGTVFLVDVHEGRARLSVLEGEVHVTRAGAAMRAVERNETDAGEDVFVPVSAALREAANEYVALDAHALAIAMRAAETRVALPSVPEAASANPTLAPASRAAAPPRPLAQPASASATPSPEPAPAAPAPTSATNASDPNALALAFEGSGTAALPTPRRPGEERGAANRRGRPGDPAPEVAPSAPQIDPFRPQGQRLIDDDAVALRRARAANDHEEAARRLESLVRNNAGLTMERVYRLDLAELYATELGRPSAAAPHWRALLDLELDAGTETYVRRSLCALDLAEDRRRCR